jgi:hypothetical protein
VALLDATGMTALVSVTTTGAGSEGTTGLTMALLVTAALDVAVLVDFVVVFLVEVVFLVDIGFVDEVGFLVEVSVLVEVIFVVVVVVGFFEDVALVVVTETGFDELDPDPVPGFEPRVLLLTPYLTFWHAAPAVHFL